MNRCSQVSNAAYDKITLRGGEDSSDCINCINRCFNIAYKLSVNIVWTTANNILVKITENEYPKSSVKILYSDTDKIQELLLIWHICG